jgi:hypothetical protein
MVRNANDCFYSEAANSALFLPHQGRLNNTSTRPSQCHCIIQLPEQNGPVHEWEVEAQKGQGDRGIQGPEGPEGPEASRARRNA